MRIAVMGTGGTGGYFGGMLARAGNDVTFIARGAHLAAIRTGGLAIHSRMSGDFVVRAAVTDDPATVGPVDLVLFCVKTYDNDVCAGQIRPLIGPDTVVLPVQNGVDSADQIGRAVGVEHVIGGVAQIIASVASPGVVVQTGGPCRLQIGELDGRASERTERLAVLLDKSHIGVAVRSDIQVALWEKLIFICAFSGMTALTRLPIGPILASPECCRLFRSVLDEAAAVGMATGVPLTPETADKGQLLAERCEPWGSSSLYHDLAAGRRLELESLNGTIVRLGHSHGVPAPNNRVICAALEPYLNGAPARPAYLDPATSGHSWSQEASPVAAPR
jgi:2-dehydropantoate 2-reductase